MLLEKDFIPLVAMDFMNDTHHEDIDIINELFENLLEYEKDSSKENEIELDSCYKKWYEHTVNHFKTEEDMMQEKAFPPYPVHKFEHDSALELMKNIYDGWRESKDVSMMKRYLIEELPTWFRTHVETMDTVTAMFFKTGLSPCSMR